MMGVSERLVHEIISQMNLACLDAIANAPKDHEPPLKITIRCVCVHRTRPEHDTTAAAEIIVESRDRLTTTTRSASV